MTGFFAIWAFDLFRRRLKLRPAELGGLVWLLAMNLPAFMLSGRTAKWYLYVPVMGLAIAVGCVMERIPALIPRVRLPYAWLLDRMGPDG